MQLQLVTLILLLLVLSSCGDVSSNKNRLAKKPTAQAATSEEAIPSGIIRVRPAVQISYADEKGSLSDSYRKIPLMAKDNEGKGNISTVTSQGRPSTVCGAGTEFKGINSRKIDCASKNGGSNTWSGKNSGAYAEGDWQLVAITDSKLEIWQDQRTGALWSDKLGNSNWCKASGNQEDSSPENLVNCRTTGNMESACVGLTADGLGDDISWRLPTRSDYLLADVNGLRFVVNTDPEHDDETGFWTATMDSASSTNSKAWVYFIKQGTLSSKTLTETAQVRCLGAPKR